MPDFSIESALWKSGFPHVAGVDEAGRGPLAGPVVIAAVVLPHHWPGGVRLDDSKRMSPEAREEAFSEVRGRAVAWRIAVIPPAEIDRINIFQATMVGMREAVSRLRLRPDYVLVDGNRVPDMPWPSRPVVKGDGLSLSIAAASVLAKVARDRIMRAYGQRFPQWGFERHKGYGTRAHLACLERYGPSPIHRATFRQGKSGMTARNILGRRGEAAAARFLEGLGYQVRERNFRCALGEIDLIAISGEFLVFVEVKTRTEGAPLHPSLSVNHRKRAKVRQLGEYYCSLHPELPLQPRFDVISVEMQGETGRVEHIANAF